MSQQPNIGRIIMDAETQAALAAIAERSGEIGATRAVKQSLFLLGVDVENQQSIDDFRAAMRHIRKLEQISSERHSQIRGSTLHGITTLTVSILCSIMTTLAASAWRVMSVVPPAAH